MTLVRYLHLLAMAFFVGGQLFLVAAVLPSLRAEADREHLRTIARRFGWGTLVAIAVLVGTGIPLAPHFHQWDSGTLHVKLALVAVVASLVVWHIRRPQAHGLEGVIFVGGPAFATRNGTRQHPDNVRSRLLAGVLERANVLLADAGEQPITHMTPHTLRRTFASLLAEIGVSPRRAMYLLGHRDPKFTMRVYQQVLDLGGTAPEQLERVLGCTVDEAFTLLSGRELRTPGQSGKRSAASAR